MILLLLSLAASPAQTDFGVRTLDRPLVAEPSLMRKAVITIGTQPFSLARAASVGARMGRVTSTVRSPERNRRVGGAANSWHLHGRAIDIARRPGVTHAMIAAELRQAGFVLIESLDEGDHSHFAFASGPRAPTRTRPVGEQLAELKQEASYFRFVSAPLASARSRSGALR